MRDLFIDALKRKYEAEIAAGKATAKVYFDKPVAIGEHPQFLDELYKVLKIGILISVLWAINFISPFLNLTMAWR